jgi:hypothetical protein
MSGGFWILQNLGLEFQVEDVDDGGGYHVEVWMKDELSKPEMLARYITFLC